MVEDQEEEVRGQVAASNGPEEVPVDDDEGVGRGRAAEVDDVGGGKGGDEDADLVEAPCVGDAHASAVDHGDYGPAVVAEVAAAGIVATEVAEAAG